MLLTTKKNRRKRDVAAAAKAHAPFVLKLCGAALLIVGVGFGGQLAWAWAQVSPQFVVKSVSVSGNARSADAELLKLAGLDVAQNLFQLDTAQLERALGTHPWVKTAKVSRHFPSGLAIAIVEHEPAAVVSLGELYLVDADGLPFKRLQAQDELDLPIVTGLDRDGYTERPLEAHDRIVAALAVLEQWKPAPAEVRTSVHGVTVVQTDGLEVRLGEGDLAAKLERLARVRRELQSRKLTADVIRLDNRMRPDWVTVQLSTSATK
ncbi:MAG: FtsQ-type POTRA domain-containing protein [Myxococcaceae bacterium]|nr:FtsQ-type POTRA domain-containing protein [Myxococcaceae bacterium]